jgi:DNA polymerase III sliding clamp (beta) subunit (PCNA family)
MFSQSWIFAAKAYYPSPSSLREGCHQLFLARTATANEWKAIAAAVKTLVEEATFEANNEGLTFRAMDPSHVALVDLTLPNSSFASFECDKPFKFSVRVEDLVKLVGRTPRTAWRLAPRRRTRLL